MDNKRKQYVELTWISRHRKLTNFGKILLHGFIGGLFIFILLIIYNFYLVQMQYNQPLTY